MALQTARIRLLAPCTGGVWILAKEATMEVTLDAPRLSASRLRGFESGAREVDGASLQARGRLPAWLRGSLLLNGPALWDLPGARMQHWFDGYAMLHRLAFGGGGVRYRSRFIQSQSYRQAQAASRPVTGEFGTAGTASLLQRLKGARATDNPAVVLSRHGQRWMAVTETPTLTYVDPDSLATQERLDLDSGAASTWRRPQPCHLEPLFVARPGGSADDDGVLLVPTLAEGDAASVLAIVDAATMNCLAEVDAPQVIPFGFHAAFRHEGG
jgi:carotenoid cleavage dioxygenase-like enzyme